MDDTRRRREARHFRRLQTLRKENPFCRICGSSKWWVRFEDHHIDGRRIFLKDEITVCKACHNEVGEMTKDQEYLPDGTDPSIAALIHRLRGQNDLFVMKIEKKRLRISWMLGAWAVMPAPPINDNKSTGAVPVQPQFVNVADMKPGDPLPDYLNPQVKEVLFDALGDVELYEAQIAANKRTLEWLLGRPILPVQKGSSNDNGDEGSQSVGSKAGKSKRGARGASAKPAFAESLEDFMAKVDAEHPIEIAPNAEAE